MYKQATSASLAQVSTSSSSLQSPARTECTHARPKQNVPKIAVNSKRSPQRSARWPGHINAANYRCLTLIAEFDRRQGWADNVTQLVCALAQLEVRNRDGRGAREGSSRPARSRACRRSRRRWSEVSLATRKYARSRVWRRQYRRVPRCRSPSMARRTHVETTRAAFPSMPGSRRAVTRGASSRQNRFVTYR